MTIYEDVIIPITFEQYICFGIVSAVKIEILLLQNMLLLLQQYLVTLFNPCDAEKLSAIGRNMQSSSILEIY